MESVSLSPSMLSRRLLFAGYTAFLIVLLLNLSCDARIFHPPNCGDLNYELTCKNSHAILHQYSGKYYVKEIHYVNRTIQAAIPILGQQNITPVFVHDHYVVFGDIKLMEIGNILAALSPAALIISPILKETGDILVYGLELLIHIRLSKLS
ncbi:unnamed protein product [Dovyalis caffra]|uniref:Wall-associated receptor kinase galacturonan-binding domain-containing protein n=1 Tax=Dovyalis caffra TaxID=77055 RepID=A0AAV1QQX8_9ROSI|nr:unnamed protein product [Dovyalis caffra]